MDQTPRSPPPPYTQEYNKPPPYFEGQNASGGPSAIPSTAQPQQHPHQQTGWYPPPPPPEQVRTQNESVQQGGTRPTVITVTSTPTYAPPVQQQVLILGNCPSCRIGFLRNEFDICGIILAILFFPIGVLCCLCMMEKRCSHCGARF